MTKKKPRGRPPLSEESRRESHPTLMFRPHPRMRKVLEEYAEKEMRTLANAVEYMLEQYMREKGLLKD